MVVPKNQLLEQTKKMGSSKKKQLPTPEHVEWLVQQRSLHQRVSSKLYGMLVTHKVAAEPLQSYARALVGTSFSLWRSMFLSDKNEHAESALESSKAFLAEVLQNNAITFTQDRQERDWTFDYYANNASFRLDYLSQAWETDLFSAVGPWRPEPKDQWERLMGAFQLATEHFDIMIRKLKAKSHQPKPKKA
ncbi:MAG TPA: hypothetical protein VHT51_10370 [Micropepsaceae bacterium]|nr:hypothetical protein [Micropepsaceae bacterium]